MRENLTYWIFKLLQYQSTLESKILVQSQIQLQKKFRNMYKLSVFKCGIINHWGGGEVRENGRTAQ